MAKRMLEKNNIPYENLEFNQKKLKSLNIYFLKTYDVEVKSFPQITIDETYVGPYTELVKRLRADLITKTT